VQASTVLLAALCVPVSSSNGWEQGRGGDALLNDGEEGCRGGEEGREVWC
jgi:hypothetical protein